jgi:hypothetical protein
MQKKLEGMDMQKKITSMSTGQDRKDEHMQRSTAMRRQKLKKQSTIVTYKCREEGESTA